MASKGRYPVHSEINLNNTIFEKATNFNYLGYNTTGNYNEDFNGKVNRFQNLFESILKTPREKTGI
jgi:hypothetical protein